MSRRRGVAGGMTKRHAYRLTEQGEQLSDRLSGTDAMEQTVERYEDQPISNFQHTMAEEYHEYNSRYSYS